MSESLFYLKRNIMAEPLFDQWYAWSHLISPATAARNVTHRHLKIMDSYIGAPQVHAAAVKNPQMLGGPFIDYEGRRVDEIRELRDRSRNVCSRLLKLSAAIEELDECLTTRGKGFSLEPLYPSIPEELKGYTEIVYDTHNSPSFRFIEPLLYRSSYYDRGLQSVMLSIIATDDRPFVMSTPRLGSKDHFHARMSFEDQRVDELFKLKYCPRTWAYIKDMFQVPTTSDDLFRSFLTPDPPTPYSRYIGNGMRWRYFGHACILLESARTSILVDPVISYSYEAGLPRYTYDDLPDHIDYVLITHNHQDHLLLETLLQLRSKIRNIIVPRNGGGYLVDPSLKQALLNIGFKNVIELGEMDTVSIEDGFIMGLPFLGEHADLNIQSKLAYLIKKGTHSLLFAADSCNIESQLYRHIHDVVGDVNVLFLGMECDGAPLTWIYSPLLCRSIERAMDQSRRLSGSNYEQAMRMVESFHCKQAYVYAMGQEPWLNYIMSVKYTNKSRPIVESDKFINECASRGIVAERLFGEKEILIEN